MARINQYKKQFKKWNIRKNVPTGVIGDIHRICKRRKEDEGKNTGVRFRGHNVPKQKIDRFEKRQKQSAGEAVDVGPPSVDSTSGFTFSWYRRFVLTMSFAVSIHPFRHQLLDSKS